MRADFLHFIVSAVCAMLCASRIATAPKWLKEVLIASAIWSLGAVTFARLVEQTVWLIQHVRLVP